MELGTARGKGKGEQTVGERALLRRAPGAPRRKRSVPRAFPVSSRMNADDRLPRASFGRVEGGDSIVEGGDGADVRAQASIPHSLNDLAQLRAVGFDDEVDRQAVGGPRLDRSDDGHERSSGSNHASGPLPDVAADKLEHEIDSADVFQDLV